MSARLGLGERREGVRQRIFRNFRTLGVGNAVASLLALLATITNSRALSFTDFGILMLLQASGMLLAGIASFSPQQPVIKLGMASLHEGDHDRFCGLVALGLIVDIASALLAGVAAVLIVAMLPEVMQLPEKWGPAALIVATSLFFTGYKTAEGIFRAFDRFDIMARIAIASSVIYVSISVLFYILGVDLVWYGLLVAVNICLSSLLQLVLAIRLLSQNGMTLRFRSLLSAKHDLREFAQYCYVSAFTSTFDQLRMNADTTLVGALVSVEAVGLYGVAKQLSGIIRKGVVIYASVVFPELASLSAQGDRSRMSKMLRHALIASAAVTGALAFATWMLGGFVLRQVFGEQFAEADGVLILLMVAAGLQIAAASYSMAVQVVMRPVALLKAYAVSSLVFVGVAIAALNLTGLPGAGYAQIAFVCALLVTCGTALHRAANTTKGTDAN